MKQRERRGGLSNLVVLASVCILFLMIFGRQMSKGLFAPGPPSYDESDPILFLESDDETRIAVSWGPARNAEWTVFYLHGNAEDLGQVQGTLATYRLRGINALSFDYRGFGLSEGAPTEKNAYRDARRVYRYAIDTLGVREDRLIVHGRSLGGGVATWLATHEKPAALILESTYLSVFRQSLPMAWIPWDKFDNASRAPDIRCRTLLIHGRNDAIVPFDHGERLAALIRPELLQTYWVDGAGHNDLEARPESNYWFAIGSFVDSLTVN